MPWAPPTSAPALSVRISGWLVSAGCSTTVGGSSCCARCSRSLRASSAPTPWAPPTSAPALSVRISGCGDELGSAGCFTTIGGSSFCCSSCCSRSLRASSASMPWAPPTGSSLSVRITFIGKGAPPETLPERLRGNLVRAAAGSCVGSLPVGRSVRSRLCSRFPRSSISSVTSRPCLRSSVCCVPKPALALAPLSSGTTFVVFGFCVLMIACPPRPTSVCSAARLLAA